FTSACYHPHLLVYFVPVPFYEVFSITLFFLLHDPAHTVIFTLSLHDALPIYSRPRSDSSGAPMSETIRLTQYSHGAGCGCKISPKVLDVILAGSGAQNLDPSLWVGNASRDDAAVYGIDGERGVVSTTDFFMPIVDDPFDFGRIAATNAISDIYAMGGDPLMAIAILGWPVNVLAPEVAREVVAG